MKKLLLPIIMVIIICAVSPIALADTVNLYANIDDSSSQCNMLIDVMRSDTNYDPYNQYAVVRAGEYDYRIYFGADLSDSELTFYKYVPSRQGTPASLTRGTANNLTINKNGYYYVGNVEGALASAQAEQYKLGAVITICAVFIVLLMLFRTFRKSEGRKGKYYSVR